MSKSKNKRTVPRSMRHKKILDIAADKPDASCEAIATEVPSATADLVENVLEEYGDPAEDSSATTPEVEDKSMNSEDAFPVPENIDDEQHEILDLIAKHPQATQAELAEKLDVSHTTVSNRANSIEGFEWDDRQAFVEEVLESDPTQSAQGDSQDPDSQPSQAVQGDSGGPDSQPGQEAQGDSEGSDSQPRQAAQGDSEGPDSEPAQSAQGNSQVPDTETVQSAQRNSQMDINGSTARTPNTDLHHRVTAIEQQLDAVINDEGGCGIFDDIDLTHKIVRACMESDSITEDDERKIVEGLLGHSASS